MLTSSLEEQAMDSATAGLELVLMIIAPFHLICTLLRTYATGQIHYQFIQIAIVQTALNPLLIVQFLELLNLLSQPTGTYSHATGNAKSTKARTLQTLHLPMTFLTA
jgi:hypothetical protein